MKNALKEMEEMTNKKLEEINESLKETHYYNKKMEYRPKRRTLNKGI